MAGQVSFSAVRSSSVGSAGSSSTVQPAPPPGFRAPAHKNSHHLHSIPPREKSTRTLIVDHMLWVHGRTRLAQARAELGMADLTGGPSSPNYTHRTRPENYDDEESVDEAERQQDLPLARTLRLRAEGLEKVVTSMLSQPPLLLDVTTTDTGSRTHRTGRHPHILPNGVRLRLALGTIVNDFFARQAPHPPHRSTSRSRARSRSPIRDHELPQVLVPLTAISGVFRVEDAEDDADLEYQPYDPPAPSYTPTAADYQYAVGLSPFAAPGSFSGGFMPPPPPPPHPLTHPEPRTRTTTSRKRVTKPNPPQRTRTLYASGVDPSTANSPPAFRCPRHLYTGCEICVEAKPPSGSASSSSRGAFTIGGSSGGSGDGGISGWKDGSGIGTGLLKPDVRGSVLRRKVGTERRGEPHSSSKGKGREGEGTGAGNTKLGRLIPRFIKLSALVAGELGREVRGEEGDGDSDTESEEDGEDSASEGEETTPTRAGVLGQQQGQPQSPTRTVIIGQQQAQTPTRSPVASTTSPRSKAKLKRSRAHRKMYENALRPTKEWYSLLEGLLTRAVVEGYLTAGWRGVGAVECLCLIGVGCGKPREAGVGQDGDEGGDEDEEDDLFEEVEPDEYPSLLEAVKVLFPSLRKEKGSRDSAEEEYAQEMVERLSRFYDIPDSTPDLSTHMEDMAWKYPAEPVERAAVRFCEAIADWRGKPELEMYKKKRQSPPLQQQQYGSLQQTSPGMMIPMESLVHSNPTSPASAAKRRPRKDGEGSSGGRPGIGVYFSSSVRERSDSVGDGGRQVDVEVRGDAFGWDASPTVGAKRGREGEGAGYLHQQHPGKRLRM